MIRLAALGLLAVHRAGRPHGDVCPRSIWCYPDGRVALLLAGDTDLRPPNFTLPDQAESLLRRADYMAPEFTQAGKAPDRLTDIYALGCTLYETIAGQVPFPGGDTKSKLLRHARAPLMPLGVPPEIERVVAHLMAKNPPIRFQDAAVVVQHLEPLAAARAEPTPEAPASLAGYEQWLAKQQPGAVADGPGAAFPPSAEPPVVPLAIVETPLPRATTSIPGAATRQSSSLRRRSGRRRRSRWLPVILGCLAALLLLIAGIYVLQRSPGIADVKPGDLPAGQVARSSAIPPAAARSAAAAGESTETEGAKAGPAPDRQVIVEDDGRLLWASPTEGPPLRLDYVPPGGQLFLVIRPAALLSLPDGQRVWQAMGPDFANAQQRWEASSGVMLGEVEQLTISLHDTGSGSPAAFFVVRLPQPVAMDQLLTKWGNPVATADLPALYQKGPWGYFVPADAEGRIFVMGPAGSRLWPTLARSNARELLRWQVARLLSRSDEQRHVTLILAPRYLFAEGQSLFAGARARHANRLLGCSGRASMRA